MNCSDLRRGRGHDQPHAHVILLTHHLVQETLHPAEGSVSDLDQVLARRGRKELSVEFLEELNQSEILIC